MIAAREIKEIDTTYIRLVADNSKAIKSQKEKSQRLRKIKSISEKIFAYGTMFATYLLVAYMIFLG